MVYDPAAFAVVNSRQVKSPVSGNRNGDGPDCSDRCHERVIIVGGEFDVAVNGGDRFDLVRLTSAGLCSVWIICFRSDASGLGVVHGHFLNTSFATTLVEVLDFDLGFQV